MVEFPATDKTNDTIKRRGLMMVLSSPSGAGKTSLTRALLEDDQDLSLSVSVTTRAPRQGEQDGVDYHFISHDIFNQMVAQHELLENAKVFDHYYGTPKQQVEAMLNTGRDVLFDIDWQGAQQLSEQAHDDIVKVFILPPSVSILQHRLHKRAQDSAETVRKRMAKASDEMSHYSEYDWVLVNGDFAATLLKLKAILASERLRRHRLVGVGEFVKHLREEANDYIPS